MADVLAGLLLFTMLSPIFVVLVLWLWIHLRGTPFFFQLRPGKKERIFKIVKFRTMNNAKDANGNLLEDKDRLTATGRFIRSASLDEIPQLINVIKGDMSLVGPRPLLPQYLPLYNDFQKKRHLVKPGITGWAQVNGRNAISWEEKFELDVYYVENSTFAMDIKILFMTVAKVLGRKDVNKENEATISRFKGSQNR